MNSKNVKKPKRNVYTWMNKNKKTIVSIICILVVMSMVFGLFAQLFFTYKAY